MKTQVFLLGLLAMASMLFGQYALPYLEDFDAVGVGHTPAYWNGNMYVDTGGMDDSHCLTYDIWLLDPTATAISPLVGPIMPGATLRFYYRFLNFWGYPNAMTEYFEGNTLTIYMGDQEVYVIDHENHIQSLDYALVEIPLDEFNLTGAYSIKFVAHSEVQNYESYFVEIDNVEVSMPDVSGTLFAATISGAKYVTAGIASPFTVNMVNYGDPIAGDDYDVHLFQDDDWGGLHLATRWGEDVTTGETQSFLFNRAFSSAGAIDLFALIEDMFGNYCESHRLSVQVLPSNTAYLYHGDDASGFFAYSNPVNYYDRNNVVQTIYLADDMLGLVGEITHITYTIKGYGNIYGDVPFQLYMTTTDMDYFPTNTSWIEPAKFTKVFEGSVNVNCTDIREVEIELTQPFVYTGGNLVVMSYKPYDSSIYFGNSWQVTSTPQPRVLNYFSSNIVIDLDHMPTGELFYTIPNMSMFINFADVGSLSGIVTSEGGAVSEALVSILGSSLYTYTDYAGYYSFPVIMSRESEIMVTKIGYDTYGATIYIDKDNPNEHNITMTALPMVNVTGIVLSSDTNSGLQGAEVRLSGYITFDPVETDIDGRYTIASVYGNRNYTISISKSGYTTYIDDLINPTDTDLTIDPVILQEMVLPPVNVIATMQGDAIRLDWETPREIHTELTYNQYNSTNDFVGTGGELEAIVVHRYTPQQLLELGVAGATLESIGFVPGMPLGQYRIVIYVGGSAIPEWHSGNLVYTQPVHSVTTSQWNDIHLTTPFTIPIDQEMWIGYESITTQGHPLGIDSGPAITGYGNLICWYGQWTELTTINPIIQGNWEIRGFVRNAYSSDDPAFVLTSPHTFTSSPLFKPSPITQSTHTRASQSIAMPLSKSYDNASTSNIAIQDTKGRLEITTNQNDKANLNSTAHSPTTPEQSFRGRAVTGYNIYRAKIDELGNQNLWTIIAVNHNATSYIDPSWSSVPIAAYRYIVQAVFNDNDVSNHSFSNMIHNGMIVPVNITVNTSDGNQPTGATVNLINNHDPLYSYQQTITTGNQITFPAVWRGIYTLTISLENYGTHINQNLPVDNNPTYYSAPLYLYEVIFAEGFEGTTFPPSGWRNIDDDNDGYMWKLGTEPGFPAYSGNAVAYSESYSYEAGMELVPRNYLVTPRIAIPNDVLGANLRYYVASQDPFYFAEHYSVMVSTTTNNVPAFTDIIFNERLTMSSIDWELRNIDLSDYVGMQIYIAFVHHFSSDMYIVKLDDIEIAVYGEVADENDQSVVPIKTTLKTNYPNPFNPSTTIAFDLAKSGNVKIDIFNIKGQRVQILADDMYTAGRHSVHWNGTDFHGNNVSSGVYFYRMQTDDFSETRRMVLLK